MSYASTKKHDIKIRAEKRHLGPEEKHILFWNVNLAWTKDELQHAKHYWEQGYSLSAMANMVKRDEYEVTLLAIEMLETGKWGTREGGAYGKEGRN